MSRRAVTLVELLVVVGVLTTLAGLLLPAVQDVRASAARSACQARLREVSLALHGHHATHGRFPPNGGPTGPPAVATPATALTWMVNLLPFVDQGPLFDQATAACRADYRTDHDPPHAGMAIPVKLYTCPTDGRLGTARTTPSGRRMAFGSFVGVAGSFIGPGVVSDPDNSIHAAPGVFPAGGLSARVADITDGTSNTLAVAERPPPDTFQAGVWYQVGWGTEPFGGPDATLYYYQPFSVYPDPCSASRYGPGRTDNPCDRYHFWSLHRGGANFAFADGSVKFLPHAAAEIMPELCGRADGATVELP